MHSSRMRTSRSLTVCCSLLPGGGVSAWSGGGLPGPRGVSAWSWGGGVVSAWSWGCLPGLGGVCLVWGVSAWSQGGLPGWGGGVCLVPGGCLPGPKGRCLPGLGEGVCLVWGGSAWFRGVLPARRPPMNRITHTCKNITLATTSLWLVINRGFIHIRYPLLQNRSRHNTGMRSSRMRTAHSLPYLASP